MNRVSWSVEGIEPSVRERAEAAARRAGMSLADWIDGQLGDSAPQPHPTADTTRESIRAPLAEKNATEVAEIHQRLDSIARQIDQISRPPVRSEPGVARQLNDAISRLDARLARITEPKVATAAPSAVAPTQAAPPRAAASAPQSPTERVEHAAAQVYHASPPLDPSALDRAIAEIAARQSELDAPVERMPLRQSPPIAPAMAPPQARPGPDFSSLEQQLLKITSQIDALQRPDVIEQSIAAFRADLADIRQTITEALPRKAIESLESEIRSLSQRLDETRANGSDAGVIAGIERALGEIRDALRSLTPAEQLAGFDEAIRNLGGKIDMIVRNSDDPGTLQQLENAIGALRGIVSNVASNEALAQLSDNVHTLADKVDQLARADSHSDSFAALESRISALTAALENRERPIATESTEQLEGAVRALSERLDQMPVGNDGSSAFAHLEQRVSYLLERMEAAAVQRGSGDLGRVEEGLQDILRMLERQQESFHRIADLGRAPAAPPFDPGVVESIKREISDIRLSQSQTGRHTQDSLEAVHNTLGHVVDRLAMIEGDLRKARSAPQPAAAREPAQPQQPVVTPPPAAPQISLPPRPEMPNPAAATAFAAAPREFAPTRPTEQPEPTPGPRAIMDILAPPVSRPSAPEPQIAPQRLAADASLPPDHPLEPGTRPPGRVASPSERIAASESAISEFAGAKPEPASSSNFIAAARRAAQAAAAATTQSGDKPKGDGGKSGPAPGKPGSTIGSKIRSLLVGASVVVIVLGTFKMAMNLLDDGHPTPAASLSEPAPQDLMPQSGDEEIEPPAANPATPTPAPSMTSPTPINRQSLFAPPQTPAAPPAPSTAPASADVTGTIPTPQVNAAANTTVTATVAIPAGETLPDAIGGQALRKAALKGDAAAAYEVGNRYADGKGITANFEEAAKWYGRAAQAGIVPAMFRMGTLNEKGLGVKKDLDTARRFYIQAADRGNAKAMHNLAVLDADGGAKGANYKSAAEWFRKAAERGVADSQFNLGILYARGIGVEQNLAESFKWFSLAAAQGDADSARKRDDVAKRLDPQSLSAARLAIQTFTVEPQPDSAVKVAAPAGGWDAQATATAKPATSKRAAR
ncbi:Sel1-like protein [Rhodopseudomonas palustris HaA2]|uniref:Sel1-like protein n=1 Tax=Rhodopseudomonas palustris (strain HaA2) TaxID=316058 RepID=Q2IR68_RHOP2|nr:tetratricopeptide repeat protein [Rhodopseudomonas palustris]ABD09292.1 Sel1-like protein [Rhodopseudomonas palustris HaA2]